MGGLRRGGRGRLFRVTARCRGNHGSRSKHRVVAEPWRLMTVLWQSVLAALIPVSASQLPGLLQAFLEHLQRQVPRKRLRSVVKFQQQLAEELG